MAEQTVVIPKELSDALQAELSNSPHILSYLVSAVLTDVWQPGRSQDELLIYEGQRRLAKDILVAGRHDSVDPAMVVEKIKDSTNDRRK